ncbi:hypothetical protein ABIE54_003347 [Chitinophagaceae bacterium OAS944]
MKTPIIEIQKKFQTNPISYFLHPTSYILPLTSHYYILKYSSILNVLIYNILQPLLLATDHFRFTIGNGKIAQVFEFQ